MTAHEVASEPAQWRAVDAEKGAIDDVAGLEQLARDFPHSGSVRLRLVNAYADAGDLDGLYVAVLWLTARGYQFGEGTEAQIAAMFDGERADRLAAVFAEDAGVVADSEIAAVVPAEAELVESVYFDPTNGNYLASSIVSRELFTIGPGGQVQRSLGNIAANLSGFAANPTTGRAWVASSYLAIPEEAMEGIVGLAELDATGWSMDWAFAPEGVNPSDLTFSNDGTAYASDPIGGSITVLPPGSRTLEEFIPPGTVRSPQGLVTNADDTILYISDYRYGLAMIDLATRAITRLDADEPILLDGIDALLRHGNELIAVQNGTSPMRIIGLQLSADGKRITDRRILEQAHPEWTEPLGATISGDTLYYIGNGQWHLYEEGGVLKEGGEPQPTQIRRIELGAPVAPAP